MESKGWGIYKQEAQGEPQGEPPGALCSGSSGSLLGKRAGLKGCACKIWESRLKCWVPTIVE